MSSESEKDPSAKAESSRPRGTDRQMTWHAGAHATTKEVLRVQAKELYSESERVASRLDADCVGTKHVQSAAQALRMGRLGSVVYDVLQTVGTTFIGLGGGGLFTFYAVPSDSKVPAWIQPLSWSLLAVGLGLIGVGITGKYKRK